MRRRDFSRGALATLGVAGLAGVLAGCAADPSATTEPGSYADGAALDHTGALVLLPPGSGAALLPRSRVLDPGPSAGAGVLAAAHALADSQRDWLSSGWQPTGPHAEMMELALLDLHTLRTEGATLAALNPHWRYVWPRDTAFAAVALSATGHLEDAVSDLHFLQGVQRTSGLFEARYLPDGSGPPDDRLPQTDGSGWALWALDAVVTASDRVDSAAGAAADLGENPAVDPADFLQLLERSSTFLLDQVDNPRSLPAPSPDYWETPEEVVTLGTAGPVLAGLHAAGRLYDRLGDTETATRLQAAAARVHDAIVMFFGPYDYPRYPGPSHEDSAVAFLLPPFQPEPLPGAVDAWRASAEPMSRPAGGIAPGAGWHEPLLSWTPETALYGYAAAMTGHVEGARACLQWLSDHRTPIGAIPEKVNSRNEPTGPAPLAWTCSLALLTELASSGHDDAAPS